MHNFTICEEPESVAQSAADYLHQQIENCLADNPNCHLALPGGTTPARCLELLSEKLLPWQKIHCYVGDERCLPVGNIERNDTMIRDKLWSRVPIPKSNQHSIAAELGPVTAASLYAELLQTIKRLDIVVLGMGEDGHTASLFPGNSALDDGRLAVPVYAAPKPPAERVSLGLKALQDAGQRIVLVTGGAKCEALRQVKAGLPLPIARVGNITWFLDTAANC